jgi:hypothetical protein
MGVAPLQDFVIGSTFQDASAQFVVVDAQKSRQTSVCAATHIGVIIALEAPLGMKPNLIERPGEIAQTVRFILRAPRFHVGNMNSILPGRNQRRGIIIGRGQVFNGWV